VTTTLHVFDTTSSRASVNIKGMNLVIRRQGELLNLEYLLQVENLTSPQKTVSDRVATFEMDFPANANNIDATYRRGPDPSPIPAETRGTNRLSLAVPLTPGMNQIHVKATLTWQEGMQIPVGSNLDIASWSILASPDWLEVRALDLESTGAGDVPGFSRQTGPPLDAGQHFPLQLFSGEHVTGEVEDVFTKEPPAAAADGEAPATEEKSGGLPLPLVFGGLLIIIVIVAVVRRRQ